MLELMVIGTVAISGLVAWQLARHTAKWVLLLWVILAVSLTGLLISMANATGPYGGLGEAAVIVLFWVPALLGVLVGTLVGRHQRARATPPEAS